MIYQSINNNHNETIKSLLSQCGQKNNVNESFNPVSFNIRENNFSFNDIRQIFDTDSSIEKNHIFIKINNSINDIDNNIKYLFEDSSLNLLYIYKLKTKQYIDIFNLEIVLKELNRIKPNLDIKIQGNETIKEWINKYIKNNKQDFDNYEKTININTNQYNLIIQLYYLYKYGILEKLSSDSDFTDIKKDDINEMIKLLKGENIQASIKQFEEILLKNDNYIFIYRLFFILLLCIVCKIFNNL